jgi:uncharacterized protein YsxB (DUF464 family)
VSREGLLRSFAADGHAGIDPRGKNIACAAVTALLRTAAKLCAERALVREGAGVKPGELRLVVTSVPEAERAWLRGVTDFLLRGMKDLQDEFPREIHLLLEVMEV